MAKKETVKKVTKTYKTKKPTGLSIKRDGKYMKCTWKIGDKDYRSGQQFSYYLNGEQFPVNKRLVKLKKYDAKTKRLIPVPTMVVTHYWNLEAKVTSKNIAIDLNKFYPHTTKTLSKFKFEISGCRDDWKETKKKVETIYETSYSDESRKEVEIKIPNAPRVSAALGSNDNQTVFSYSCDNSSSSLAWFVDYQWQSMVLINSSVTDGSKLTWKNNGSNQWQAGTGTGTSITITEEFIGDTNTITRWFRVRSRGPRGASAWKYAKHVYSVANRASSVRGGSSKLSSNTGYQVKVSWDSENSAKKPIDTTIIEYAIGTPSSSHSASGSIMKSYLSVPNDPSWTEVATLKDTKGLDGYLFYIGRLLDPEECLWIRINNKHDNRTTPGIPEYIRDGAWTAKNYKYLNGGLPSPTLGEIDYNASTNKAIINVTNNSSISCSFVAVYFRTDAKGAKQQLVGIIPAGESSATIQLPDPEGNNIAIGIKTYIADYSPINPDPDAVMSYSISNIKMESPGIVWEEGAIPLPPTNFNIFNAGNGTIRATWDWTWTLANGAELSWANHADAWESTDGPETYEINNTHVGAWYISGLEIDKWYVRVRLYKEDSDGRTYGAYSETRDIKLSSSPLIPILELSDTVVPKDGSVTCYWVYTSNDGTSQISAEVCEATIKSDGTIEYGEIIAEATVSQNLTIDIKQLSWLPGETHYLALRVSSASGEKSEGWSEIVPIRIADPVEAKFISTSLVDRTEILQRDLDPDEAQDFPDATPITRYYKALTKLPLTAITDGAGTDGETTFIIERADSYHMERPDGSDKDGYEGETIFLQSPPQSGDGNLVLNQSDIIGYLDDGAKYRLIAIVKDTYGQIARATIDEYILTSDTDLVYDNDNYKDYYTRSGSGTDQDPYVYLYVNLENEFTYTLTSDTEIVDGKRYYIRSETTPYTYSVIEEPNVSDISTYYERDPINPTTKGWYELHNLDYIDFDVEWEHQALMPEALVETNQEEYYTIITPIAPLSYILTSDTTVVENKEYFIRTGSGTEEDPYDYEYVESPSANPSQAGYYEVDSLTGDTCDIYRLSADIPELIYQGAIFGCTYVDPYATIGDMGGHRIVYKTVNGDYITEDNRAAWVDFDDEDNKLNLFATIIDFDKEKIILPYDIELSSKWAKDFTETHYLGGAVQGDWNPAVSRTGSVKSSVIVEEDPETIKALRRLADFPGICHVRTPDGSTYAANVEVSEDRENRFVRKHAKFTLDVTRVDSEGFDGMLYDEWIRERE